MTGRSTADEVVSRLISQESAASPHQDAASAAAGVVIRVSANLARFIGSDGCLALLTRARAQTLARHPALQHITIVAQSDPVVGGLAESIKAHGEAATMAGLEATLVALIGLLGRLIGDELAMKLVEENAMNGGLPGGEAAQ